MSWNAGFAADIGGEAEMFSPFVSPGRDYAPAERENEQGELSSSALQSAVSENTRYQQTLGWGAFIDRIAQQALGFTDTTPDMATFTKAVATWQARNGLTPDGAIGPMTWTALRRVLGITTPAGQTT